MNLQWKAASGFVQGFGHEELNEPCQDRTIHFHDENVHGIILADGAGSCRFGGEGAELIVQSILTNAKEKFDDWYDSEQTAELLEESLVQLIDEEVKKYELAERMDFSCTLLFVLVKDHRYLAGHIGDGVIFQRVNNALPVLSYPENGRYTNETYFITMAPLNEHFRIYKGELNAHTDFMVMSDGAATSFYVYEEKEIEEKNTAILFNHLVENNEQEVNEELQDLLKMIRENTSDDCALSLLVSHTVDMIEPFAMSIEENDETEEVHEITEQPSTNSEDDEATEQMRNLAEEASSNDEPDNKPNDTEPKAYKFEWHYEQVFDEEDDLEVDVTESEDQSDFDDDDYMFEYEHEEIEMDDDFPASMEEDMDVGEIDSEEVVAITEELDSEEFVPAVELDIETEDSEKIVAADNSGAKVVNEEEHVSIAGETVAKEGENGETTIEMLNEQSHQKSDKEEFQNEGIKCEKNKAIEEPIKIVGEGGSN